MMRTCLELEVQLWQVEAEQGRQGAVAIQSGTGGCCSLHVGTCAGAAA